MIEFETLGPVRGKQQQAGLPPARFPAPLGQPVEKMVERQFGVTDIECILAHRLAQIAPPMGVRPTLGLQCQPLPDRWQVDQRTVARSQPADHRLRFAQSPEAAAVFIGLLHRHTLQFAIAAQRVE